MSVSDPISDMLTRIRNAHSAEREFVEIPFSRMKGEIVKILKREGFVKDYVTEGGTKKVLRVFLKYSDERSPAITGLRRISRPGRREYSASQKIPRVVGGMGVAILSTSAGMMTDREARKRQIGGEVLCAVW